MKKAISEVYHSVTCPYICVCPHRHQSIIVSSSFLNASQLRVLNVLSERSRRRTSSSLLGFDHMCSWGIQYLGCNNTPLQTGPEVTQ